jgi:hypothetical protein
MTFQSAELRKSKFIASKLILRHFVLTSLTEKKERMVNIMTLTDFGPVSNIGQARRKRGEEVFSDEDD